MKYRLDKHVCVDIMEIVLLTVRLEWFEECRVKFSKSQTKKRLDPTNHSGVLGSHTIRRRFNRTHGGVLYRGKWEPILYGTVE